MKTQLIKDDIAAAAKLIKAGELVAVPTETVYGLAGNGMSEAAVEKIYEVKGRPAIKPLALMVHDPSAMKKYCEDVPPQALSLAKRFWPGPLSIVLKAKQSVPEIVRAGGKTVSLRCPDHPLTLELIKRAGLPLAAPSANPSGKESLKNGESVLNYFDGKIVYVNVMKNMSVDCDCCAVAEDPCIADIGILASDDPIAIDQACLDMVYASKDPGRDHLIERIESRHGVHTVEAAAQLGFGSREYELVEL